jgi:hypothetical protein
MQIDCNDWQLPKLHSPIVETAEPGAKVTTDSIRQLLKHELQIVSTPSGTQIACNEEQLSNPRSPITESVEFDSNVTTESISHTAKQRDEIAFTVPGMQIDFSKPRSNPSNKTARNAKETLNTLPFTQTKLRDDGTLRKHAPEQLTKSPSTV